MAPPRQRSNVLRIGWLLLRAAVCCEFLSSKQIIYLCYPRFARIGEALVHRRFVGQNQQTHLIYLYRHKPRRLNRNGGKPVLFIRTNQMLHVFSGFESYMCICVACVANNYIKKLMACDVEKPRNFPGKHY